MSPHQHLPHRLAVCEPRSQRRCQPHLAHRKSLQLISTELLPTFPQAVATFPAQTQRHGRASELPFLIQRNACQAAGQGYSPDSTCHVGDLGFISTSQMQGDGRWGDKLPEGQQVKHEHQRARSRRHATPGSAF